MDLTLEHMKIFLFTGVIAGTAMAVLFSGGQFDMTTLDFEGTITMQKAGENMTYLAYTIHNTGNTDIVKLSTNDSIGVEKCIQKNLDKTSEENPLLSRNHVQYEEMCKDSSINYGDDYMVTFTATDSIGNVKIQTKVVRVN